MSGDEPAGDDEGQEAASFVSMAARETFDGRERVMSRAAYDLQVLATVHSASCGHPGLVPDDYLEHLDGLGSETTITAAELCISGLWERTGGGYRILDWEAVEYALDGVRQRKGQDPRALAEERDHETRALIHLAKPLVITPPCAVCGTPSARIELVAPGQLPAEGDQWPAPCKPASCGTAGQDNGASWSPALRPGTATVTPSTPPGPGRSPGRSGLPCVSPRSAPPGSTTMPDSAPTATLLTAASTGTYPGPGTVRAPAATARAWTHTGRLNHPRARHASCFHAYSAGRTALGRPSGSTRPRPRLCAPGSRIGNIAAVNQAAGARSCASSRTAEQVPGSRGRGRDRGGTMTPAADRTGRGRDPFPPSAGLRGGYSRIRSRPGQGCAGAIADVKAVQRGLVLDAGLEARRWGPGGRARFASPRPGGFPCRAESGPEIELEAG